MQVSELIQGPELLSPDEVAARLNVERHMVYALVRYGELRAIRVGRLLRIPADAVARYIAAGGSRVRA